MALHAMIDLETLDTRVTAAVLSIGIAFFEDKPDWHVLDADTTGAALRFHAAFDLDEQLRIGRTVSASTFRWWMSQSDEARKRVISTDLFVYDVDGMRGILAQLLKDAEFIWSRGNAFDIAILDHMFVGHGGSPWRYSKVRDSRTFLDWATGSLPERLGTAHDAYDDALHEARCVCATGNMIRGWQTASIPRPWKDPEQLSIPCSGLMGSAAV